jgi:hypothetical protein
VPGAPELTFQVNPNPTRLARTGALRAGDAVLTIQQDAGKFAAIAAAPGRLEITLKGRKAPRQTVTTWSDDPNAGYLVSAEAKWLKIKPQTRKSGPQRFDIEIAAAELQPGRHEASIEITSPGSVGHPVRIPVVVHVETNTK